MFVASFERSTRNDERLCFKELHHRQITFENVQCAMGYGCILPRGVVYIFSITIHFPLASYTLLLLSLSLFEPTLDRGWRLFRVCVTHIFVRILWWIVALYMTRDIQRVEHTQPRCSTFYSPITSVLAYTCSWECKHVDVEASGICTHWRSITPITSTLTSFYNVLICFPIS